MHFLARLRRGLAVALLVLSGACTGLLGLPSEPPRVSLTDIGIEQLGLLEQKLRLGLRVQNPNDAEIAIAGLSFSVEVNGQPFAQGVSDHAVRVPRYGEATLQVSAVTGLASLWRQLRELQKGGRESIGYRLQGRLNLEGGLSVPFDHRGEVPLPWLLGEGPRRT